MSKRALTILVAALLAVGTFGAVANAGVEGDFTFDISIRPQVQSGATMAEMAKFDFDFEGLLDLDITLSGLTFGNDLAIGIAGIEHYIMSLSTTLGALDLMDEFAFAAPYSLRKTYWKIVDHVVQPGTPTTDDYDFIDNNYYRASDLRFVKKRVSAEITLGGLTFDNLVLFEDISFYHPITVQSTVAHEYDADGDGTKTDWSSTSAPKTDGTSVNKGDVVWTIAYADGTLDLKAPRPGTLYNCTAVDPDPANDKNGYVFCDFQPNGTFGFGNIFSISGTTVSGIVVTNKTGFNADWRVMFFPAYSTVGKLTYYNYFIHEYPGNKIKKKTWPEAVVGTAWEFVKEEIDVENIVPVEGITLNSYTIWDSTGGFTTYLNGEFSLAGIAEVSVWLTTANITTLSIKESVISFAIGDYMKLIWKDANGSLAMDAGDTTVFQFGLPLQAATLSGIIQAEPGVGLKKMTYDAYVPVGDLYFEGTVYFTGGPPPVMNEYEFTIGTISGGTIGGLELELYADFYMDYLSTVGIEITIPFAA